MVYKGYKVIQLFSRLTEQPVDLAKHRFQFVRDSPQQPPRSLDCGIFCVLYLMYKITRDSSIFQRSSNQMRTLMNEILDNQTDTTLNYPLDYDLELNFNLKKIPPERTRFHTNWSIFPRFKAFSVVLSAFLYSLLYSALFLSLFDFCHDLTQIHLFWFVDFIIYFV